MKKPFWNKSRPCCNFLCEAGFACSGLLLESKMRFETDIAWDALTAAEV